MATSKKRTKTYSLDDIAIELLQEMANLKDEYTQSGILNEVILDKARDLCKSKSLKFARIRALVKTAQQQGVLPL